MRTREHLLAGRIVAIIRVPSLTTDQAVELTEVLVGEGIRALEFTLTSTGALAAIGAAVSVAGGRASVGAGTVLTADDVDAVADVGGEFVVAPNVSEAVIRRSLKRGLEPLPGALTPTEVRLAVEFGAGLIKLFPAEPGGLEYFRAIRAPLDDVAFVPTGGIGIDEIGAYLDAGAVAVGLGSALVSGTDDLDGLRTRARAAVKVVETATVGAMSLDIRSDA